VNSEPQITRVRHEVKRRRLTVTRVEQLSAQMVRVVLGGAALQGFTSLGFDDHIKLFFPTPAGDVEMRDFTPRRFDAQKLELWIDFFLHEAGPAATWAAQAAVGQSLEIGGPKGSAVISIEGIQCHVLVGDETALPAISRRLDEMPAGARALVVVEVDAGSIWPPLTSPAAIEVVWVQRDGSPGAPGHELIEALRKLEFPAEQTFVWVAVETQAARAIRRYLREERAIDKRWIKAAGYWQRGAIGAHQKIADDE
jgi:NADPH-dependent ferric siderophore reductase